MNNDRQFPGLTGAQFGNNFGSAIGGIAGCASQPRTATELLQPRDKSEIERELGLLQGEISRLHETISALSTRLDPVRMQIPESNGAGCAEPACCSQIGAMVNEFRHSVTSAARRLDELLASLAI